MKGNGAVDSGPRSYWFYVLPLFGAAVFSTAAPGQTQPAAPSPQMQPPPSPQMSPALAALLSEASSVNAQIPERLRAYRAKIESEMSLVVLDSGGRERTAQVEQVASDVRWRAPDRYDQRVVGYRQQSIGPTFSLMSFF